MLQLVLARHGQSYGNLDRSLGHDTDLTEKGRQQAAQLREWLAAQGYRFTALYCSPLRRARQTAEAVDIYFGLEIVVDPDLRETEVPYVHALPCRGAALDAEEAPSFAPEYDQMYRRVRGVTWRILTENLDGEVLVVAHSGTLGTMLRCILATHALLVHTDLAAVHGLRWDDGGRWHLQYTNRLPGGQ